MKLKHLDLFSGIGGFALGLKWAGGFETIGFSEIDKYCCKLLKQNFGDIPNYGDIRTWKADGLRGMVDIITGGYPCQPFSVAGKQLAEQDERHLWPEMLRIIQAIRPRYIIAENVAGHIKLGFDTVASQMEAEGYTVTPFVIPACAVAAPHRRDRIWIVANTNNSDDRRKTRENERERERVKKNKYNNGTKYGSLLSQMKYKPLLPTLNSEAGITVRNQVRAENGSQEHTQTTLYHYGLLPTMGANEYKGTSKKRYKGSKDFRGAKTSEGLRTTSTDPIYLNPSFAELMMGYPLGWTELKPSETQ